MRALNISFATIVLALLVVPAHADDAKRLSGDEIRTMLLGHQFRTEYGGEDGPSTLRAYFSDDGKMVVQLDISDDPVMIATESYELRENRICLHDLGLMRKVKPDRCFGVYVETADTSSPYWSGRMADEQNPDSAVSIVNAFPVGAEEIADRWTKWESIRQEAGSLDGFARMEDVSINPYRFRGKIQIVIGYFEQMIGDRTGRFRAQGSGPLVVKGIPNDLFGEHRQAAVIVGEFTETMRVTEDGSDRFLPVMTAKAARICLKNQCKDYIDGY